MTPALRISALVTLAIIGAGCNAIFGLDPVSGRDAAPPPEAPPPPEAATGAVQLTFMVAELDGGGPGAISFPEIPDDVLVELRAGTSSEDLAPVARDASGVLVPLELLDGNWRLEYTLAGQAPVELQWAARAGVGHFVVPVLGRLARTPPPDGARYELSATGPGTPSTFGNARMMTIGVWMEQLELTGGLPLVVAMDETTSQSGARAAPDPQAGDAIVLAEYDRAEAQLGNLCDNTIGSASYEGAVIAPLAANTATPITTTWEVSASEVPTVSYPGGLGVQRLHVALADPTGTRDGTVSALLQIGALAHSGMPAFTRERDGAPAPVMLPWVECRQSQPITIPDSFRPPVAASNLERAAYVAVTDTRPRNGIDLVSSLVGITPGSKSETTFAVDFGVPLAIQPILLGALDLTAEIDGQELDSGTGELELTFKVEDVGKVDYFEVTVLELAGGALVPRRVYVQANPAEPSVQIDHALFVAGHEYVLQIRCIRGQPDAATGNFAVVEGPQAVSTVFTRTFKAK